MIKVYKAIDNYDSLKAQRNRRASDNSVQLINALMSENEEQMKVYGDAYLKNHNYTLYQKRMDRHEKRYSHRLFNALGNYDDEEVSLEDCKIKKVNNWNPNNIPVETLYSSSLN